MSNPTNLSNTTSARDKIESRVNPANTAALTVGAGGAMTFQTMTDMMEFAKLMSISQVAVPKHLRENPGACLAVVIQASEWQMSPFAVANKSYSVNDRLAYEAQLVAAVILRRAPIRGRFKVSYTGEAATRKCTVSVATTDGEVVEYESPAIGLIKVKNSPLWTADPDQQLYYFSARSLCRRHFPDVLLGVYTMDEMQDSPIQERQATGRVVTENPMMQNPYLAAPEPQAFSDLPEPNQQEPAPADEAPQPSLEPVHESPIEVSGPTEHEGLMNEIREWCLEHDAKPVDLSKKARAAGLIPVGKQLADLDVEALRVIAENVLDIFEGSYKAAAAE